MIIILYILSSKLHSPIIATMFGMAISETIGGIGRLLSFQFLHVSNPNSGEFENVQCFIQRFCLVYSDLATPLLLLFLCYSIHDLMIKNSKKLEENMKAFILIGLLCPFIIASLLIGITYTNDYAEPTMNEAYIYVTRSQCFLERKFLIEIIFHGFCLVINVLIIVLEVKVIMFINENGETESNRTGLKNKLLNYLIVSLPTFVFNVTEKVFYMLAKDNIQNKGSEIIMRLYFIFVRLQGTFSSLRGVLVLVIFINNNKVQTRLKELIDKLFSNIDNINLLQLPTKEEEEAENSKKKIKEENTEENDNNDEEQIQEYDDDDD